MHSRRIGRGIESKQKGERCRHESEPSRWEVKAAAEVAPVAEKAIRCPDAKPMWSLNAVWSCPVMVPVTCWSTSRAMLTTSLRQPSAAALHTAF